MKKLLINTTLFFSLGISWLSAQNDITAAGGDANGSGGSSSFSIGQVVYTAERTSNGSVNQGVQQPYDFIITKVKDVNSMPFDAEVYPNPTQSSVELKLSKLPVEPLFCELFSIEGKVISRQSIANFSTSIQLQDLPPATYFLRITGKVSYNQTFKIVKVR